MKMPFKKVNIVCTTIFSRPEYIKSLPQLFPNKVKCDERRCGGYVAYFKSESMRGNVIIFPSGKIISLGTRSIEESIKELNLVVKAFSSELTEYEIHNIIATTYLNHVVNLEQSSSLLKK